MACSNRNSGASSGSGILAASRSARDRGGRARVNLRNPVNEELGAGRTEHGPIGRKAGQLTRGREGGIAAIPSRLAYKSKSSRNRILRYGRPRINFWQWHLRTAEETES